MHLRARRIIGTVVFAAACIAVFFGGSRIAGSDVQFMSGEFLGAAVILLIIGYLAWPAFETTWARRR